MKKYTIKDTIACWVTWSYEIEADSEADAITKYRQEQPTSPTPPEIGDTIDGYEQILEVEA